MGITFRFCSSLWRIFYFITIMLFICSVKLRFLMTLELNYILVCSNYVWKWRESYVSFLLIIVTYLLLRHNYVVCLFDVITFFDDVRITLHFGTFELRMESTLWDGHFLVTFVGDQKMTKKIRNYYVIC